MSSPLTLHGVVPLAWEWEAAGEGSSSAWQAVQKCAEKWSDEASYGECLSHLVFEILPSANTFAGCQDQPRVLGSTLHGVPLTVKHPGVELELASPCPAVASSWANWPARGGELRVRSRRQLPQLSCLTEVFSGEKLFLTCWRIISLYDGILLQFWRDLESQISECMLQLRRTTPLLLPASPSQSAPWSPW